MLFAHPTLVFLLQLLSVHLACGHMFLLTPSRLTNPAATIGPLQPTGTVHKYPCQMSSTGDQTPAGPNTDMAVGSTQPLRFQGTTVHGGGSCQVSVTYDSDNLSESSTFKVIKSWVGGCPARDQDGNLTPADSTAVDPYTYSFEMLDIPNGKAILGWSWIPRMGVVSPAIEMFMQCAAITITGATSVAASNYKALPDILIANINTTNTCTSVHSIGNSIEYPEAIYPNPGPQVTTYSGSYPTSAASYTLETCAGNHGGAAGTGTYSGVIGGATSGGGAAAASTQPAAATTSSAEAQPAASSSNSVPVGVTPVVPSMSSSASASASVSMSVGSSGSSGGSCTLGTYDCVGGTHYRQCLASETWSILMSMAAGTRCKIGTSTSLGIEATTTGNVKFRPRNRAPIPADFV